ncbi:hypothetical protein [Roseovarius confluentis]|uniref:hypothetical protein n=1 Tax=Roseovarius confluentis TaxID=1852027 RepID=UPI0014742FAC|nr:hypothetical protein [Roseovarius confluentis]
MYEFVQNVGVRAARDATDLCGETAKQIRRTGAFLLSYGEADDRGILINRFETQVPTRHGKGQKDDRAKAEYQAPVTLAHVSLRCHRGHFDHFRGLAPATLFPPGLFCLIVLRRLLAFFRGACIGHC